MRSGLNNCEILTLLVVKTTRNQRRCHRRVKRHSIYKPTYPVFQQRSSHGDFLLEFFKFALMLLLRYHFNLTLESSEQFLFIVEHVFQMLSFFLLRF